MGTLKKIFKKLFSPAALRLRIWRIHFSLFWIPKNKMLGIDFTRLVHFSVIIHIIFAEVQIFYFLTHYYSLCDNCFKIEEVKIFITKNGSEVELCSKCITPYFNASSSLNLKDHGSFEHIPREMEKDR